MFEVGCFEVNVIAEGKWRVKNTLTGSEHTTYGTRDEVVEQLTRQSGLWKQKFAERDNKSKKGGGFRERMGGEAKAALAKRAAGGR